MEFVIISGMSGAGKTSALHIMEAIGCWNATAAGSPAKIRALLR